MKNPKIEWLTNTPIAHRGLHNGADIPENSFKAFENAINNNFSIEMDIQVTLDGVPVVFHDDNLLRMTGLDKNVNECQYDEIKNLTLLATSETIPSFAEFLTFVDGKVPLLIEIKTHSEIGIAEKIIWDVLKDYNGVYAVQSFNPFIVKWFADNAPAVVRGQLSCNFANSKLSSWKKFMLKNLLFSKWNKSQFIAYGSDSIAKNKAVKRWKQKVPVLCWTIQTQEQFDSLSSHFDNIIFENFIPKK